MMFENIVWDLPATPTGKGGSNFWVLDMLIVVDYQRPKPLFNPMIQT